MKLVKKQKKTDKREIIRTYITEAEQYVIFAYLFCMLGIFPLFYKEQYYKIGDVKFDFFWKASLLFITVSGFFLIIKMIVQKMHKDYIWNLKKYWKKAYVLNKVQMILFR